MPKIDYFINESIHVNVIDNNYNVIQKYTFE